MHNAIAKVITDERVGGQHELLIEQVMDAIHDVFLRNYGPPECRCEIYKPYGRHEPNSEGCPQLVYDYIGLSDG
jgi:hypothetical protein